MRGLMQHHPLRIIDILTFAAEAFPGQGLVSVEEDGSRTRVSYRQAMARVAQLANALQRLGVSPGDRVATLGWNTHRHFELYYGISGIGAVCHTINPRLSADQMRFIVEHAGDTVIFVDPSLVHLIETMPPAQLQHVVILGSHAQMPSFAQTWLCYEDLLSAEDDSCNWPVFPEDTAAGLCYTSGTTGDPKGALYSHRSTVLHALMTLTGHPQSLQTGKTVLPVVPLFHVNAWGLPYIAPLTGMNIVMPGARLDGSSLFDLMDDQHVFSAWGVPTVWAGLMQEIQARGRIPNGFADLVVGGSAAPRSMIAAFEAMGVNVNQAWGMTEMSPIGTRGILPPALSEASPEEQIDAKVGAGRRLFGVDFKLVGEDGETLPHDGQSEGELFVRGNTVISGYFSNEAATRAAMDQDGWFGTGDVATLDDTGRLVIRDRAKDLVKSGGEWISSIDIENAAVAHPGIAACAVIAVPHPKWDERPILIAVAATDPAPSLGGIHAQLAHGFARWQLPDDVLYVDALPLTATGKVSKLTLRRQFADYILPELREA